MAEQKEFNKIYIFLYLFPASSIRVSFPILPTTCMQFPAFAYSESLTRVNFTLRKYVASEVMGADEA